MTKGIIYYNEPEKTYEGDEIKNASLTGAEVDHNFNTLEGRDIKSIEFAKDTNDMIVNLINGDTIVCKNPFDNTVNTIDFKYDKDKGILTVIINGDTENPKNIKDFMTEDKVKELIPETKVFSDTTINGTGTASNPLSISNGERTGVFKSVLGFKEELPTTGNKVGDRYVTNETVNKYGSLYNFTGITSIINNLEKAESKWHVARKSDWADMLNALEPNIEDRNHDRTDCNVYLGKYAGEYLAQDKYNFNFAYSGYAYNEGGDTPHLVFCELIEGATTKQKRAAWWTSSNQEGRNAYIKRVDADCLGGVYQDIVDGVDFYPVRLVRDMTENEIISAEDVMGDGVSYPVTAMPSSKNGLRIWTAINLDYVLPKEAESSESTTLIDVDSSNRYKPELYKNNGNEDYYYINEWNGSTWLKFRIYPYDTFFDKELNDFCYIDENGKLVAIHDEIYSRIETLEKNHMDDVMKDVIDYKYSDGYSYTGSFTIKSYNKDDKELKIEYKYTGEKTTEEEIMHEVMFDYARFLGATYRTHQYEPITFNGNDYYWYPLLGLKGSNYGRLDSEGNIITLVSDFSAYYKEKSPSYLTFTINKNKVQVGLVE